MTLSLPALGLIDLPHPIRVDAAFGRPMAEALFGAEFWTALKPYLGDETLPTEWILNHAPCFCEFGGREKAYLKPMQRPGAPRPLSLLIIDQHFLYHLICKCKYLTNRLQDKFWT